MEAIGNKNDLKFVPQGNAQKPGIITPKTDIIAKKTDSLSNESSDPSHK